jgi:hypothetical protein
MVLNKIPKNFLDGKVIKENAFLRKKDLSKVVIQDSKH